VRNLGSRVVVLFVVTFGSIDSAGEYHLPGVQVRNYRSSEPKLRPGTLHLVTPVADLTGYLQTPAASPQGPRYTQALDALTEFTRTSHVLAALDGALYEDGQFVGPDKLDTFGRLTAESKVADEMYQKLLDLRTASDDRLLAALAACQQEQPPPPSGDTGLASSYINSTYAHSMRNVSAAELMQVLRVQGRSAYEQLLLAKLASTKKAAAWR
jgi:hypothetical protein